MNAKKMNHAPYCSIHASHGLGSAAGAAEAGALEITSAA
jgi:hypothetical protein